MTNPTDRFLALVEGPEDRIPLDEAALLLSAHADAGVDVAAQLGRLDDLAACCDEASVDGVVDLLFGRLGLRGNVADYGDPRNSFLDQVLDRRLGIPISLSVLVMEVGRRLGLRFEGLGCPGHFLVRHIGVPVVVLDPFNGGRRLDIDAVEALYHSIHGPEAPFSTALLAVAPPRAILARMLANLRSSYRERNEPAGLLWVACLLAGLPGVPPGEVADTGRFLAEGGWFVEAARVYEALAGSSAISADDAERLRLRARLLRAQLN